MSTTKLVTVENLGPEFTLDQETKKIKITLTPGASGVGSLTFEEASKSIKYTEAGETKSLDLSKLATVPDLSLITTTANAVELTDAFGTVLGYLVKKVDGRVLPATLS